MLLVQRFLGSKIRRRRLGTQTIPVAIAATTFYARRLKTHWPGKQYG